MVEFTSEELRLLRDKVISGSEFPGDPRIPDAPDIAQAPLTVDSPEVTDEEFFVGRRYRPHGRKSRTGATFEIVEHAKEPRHRLFDQVVQMRYERKGLKPRSPSFYVCSPRGTIGWVPWIGSTVVWPWEAAWEVDLLNESEPDLKPSEQKKR